MHEDRLAIIQNNFEEIWVNGNVDLFDLSIDPDIVRHNPPFPDIHGLAAYKQYIKGIRSAMSNVEFKIEDIIFMQDLSSARVTMTFTHTGMMHGLQIPATGRRVTLQMGAFSCWEGGKIIEEWAYIDYLGFLQQVGVIPTATG